MRHDKGSDNGRRGWDFSGSDLRLTFVPVLQRGHHKEADGLVGALLQDGGGETLVRPSQPWREPRHGGEVRV